MKSTPAWLKVRRRSKRPFKTPRVCTAELVLADGTHVSKMYGVAFNNVERQGFYGLFKSTYGWQARYGKLKAEFKCEALCGI